MTEHKESPFFQPCAYHLSLIFGEPLISFNIVCQSLAACSRARLDILTLKSSAVQDD